MIKRAYQWAKDFQLGLLAAVVAAVLLAGLVVLVRKRLIKRGRGASAQQGGSLPPRAGAEAAAGRSSVPLRAGARD
jgi:hypothetical protein